MTMMKTLSSGSRRRKLRTILVFVCFLFALALSLISSTSTVGKAGNLYNQVVYDQVVGASPGASSQQNHSSSSSSPLTTTTPNNTNNNAPTVATPLPRLEALEAFEQYKKWHSHQTLLQESTTTRQTRLYAIGYYSCPNQAGNRLHHFFNSLLWAIVTNRTLLWKYYDQETCQKFNEGYDKNICNSANHVQDCDQVLERATWIPSLEEWNTTTRLQLEPPTVAHFWTTHPHVKVTQKDVRAGVYTGTHIVGSKWYPWKDEYKHDIGLDNKTTNQQVLIFPIMPSKYQDLVNPKHREYLLKTEWAREIARKLYSEGTGFLYGMFFRQSFRILNVTTTGTTTTATTPNQPSASSASSSFSVALHSRHKYEYDEGRDVSKEIACLEALLKHRPITNNTASASPGISSRSPPCEIFLMSDRNLTLQKLKAWVETSSSSSDCAARIAEHDAGTSFRVEHGPFSGKGFFQDLTLAANARHGFAGMRRSSSDLVLEVMEYDRRMQARAAGKRLTTDISFCLI